MTIEAIKFAYEDVIDTLNFHEFESDGELFLALISIKKEHRGKGFGSLIMKKICEYADSKRLTITLTPLEGGLEDFYSRKFGFVLNEGNKEILTIKDRMYRKPNVIYLKYK